MPTYPTPHIHAAPADFAETVLMPGDPLRAKFIAENYLENAKLVNDVRGVQGYTGTYAGMPISVMASGMGMPSIGIYSYELYNIFGVQNIIRVGSAGALRKDVAVRDIIIAQGACTDSAFAAQYGLSGSFAPIADYALLERCVHIARQMEIRHFVGNILSTDVFYGERQTASIWGKMGVLAVEMETAALYMNAACCGKKALAICTVSDHLITGQSTDAEERRSSFTEMIELALKTAVYEETK